MILLLLLLLETLIEEPDEASVWKYWRSFYVNNLKQNEAQSAGAKSIHKGVNLTLEIHNKTTNLTKQQTPESPTVTLTWHACKYKVQKLRQRYIFNLLLYLSYVFPALINSVVCRQFLRVEAKCVVASVLL